MTIGMIGKKELGAMRDSAAVINVDLELALCLEAVERKRVIVSDQHRWDW